MKKSFTQTSYFAVSSVNTHSRADVGVSLSIARLQSHTKCVYDARFHWLRAPCIYAHARVRSVRWGNDRNAVKQERHVTFVNLNTRGERGREESRESTVTFHPFL